MRLRSGTDTNTNIKREVKNNTLDIGTKEKDKQHKWFIHFINKKIQELKSSSDFHNENISYVNNNYIKFIEGLRLINELFYVIHDYITNNDISDLRIKNGISFMYVIIPEKAIDLLHQIEIGNYEFSIIERLLTKEDIQLIKMTKKSIGDVLSVIQNKTN